MRFYFLKKEVGEMKIDKRLLTGIFVGMVLGLHYHAVLVAYLPLLMVAALVLVLKSLHP